MKKLFKNILAAGAFVLAMMLASCANSSVTQSSSSDDFHEDVIEEETTEEETETTTSSTSSEATLALEKKYYLMTGCYTADGIAMYTIDFNMPSTFCCTIYNIDANGNADITFSDPYCVRNISVRRSINDTVGVIIEVHIDGHTYKTYVKTPTKEEISNF